MNRSGLDDKKISIILCKRSEPAYARTVQALEHLEAPNGYQVDVLTVPAESSRARAYNAAMSRSDAKYKLYVGKDIDSADPRMLVWLLNHFLCKHRVGMIGLWGSDLPMDGNFMAGGIAYGSYAWRRESGSTDIRLDVAEVPMYYQEVKVLDDSFLATGVDLPWDEEVDSAFLAAAQCCRMRRAGYKSIVAMQEWNEKKFWMVFSEPREAGKGRPEEWEPLEEGRERFLDAYRKDILPLVSILIPTYNQPEFFRAALESALAQDYGNIEIIVGDDSTDERTKELIQPYLRKYPQIQYYFHGGPLREQGMSNIDFVLEKSSGEYVNYLFHDDVFLEGKISRMMEHFLRDLNEEIGFVTSERYRINPSGKATGYFAPWVLMQDATVAGQDIGRRIFVQGDNFIGEMTTVLIRKKLLYIPDLGTYRIGHFFGVRDQSMGDISTWLEICRQGKKVVFMKDKLSAFRLHPDQNTHKASIRIRMLLDWICYVVVAWLHGCFLESEEECLFMCRERIRTGIRVPIREEALDAEDRTYLGIIQELTDAVHKGNDAKIFHLVVLYAMSQAADPSSIQRLCKKDPQTGYWRKR